MSYANELTREARHFPNEVFLYFLDQWRWEWELQFWKANHPEAILD